VAFVEYIDNAVIVDVFSPFADYTAAGGTGGDFFRHRLIAFWTKFHRLRTNRMKTGPVERNRRSAQDAIRSEYLYSYQYIIDNPRKCVKQVAGFPKTV
jgi:hypothetical protein